MLIAFVLSTNIFYNLAIVFIGDVMKVVFSFSKNYALILCVLFLVCFGILSLAGQNTKLKLYNEKERCDYIASKGYNNIELISYKEISVSAEQKSLLKYSGKTADFYTYLADKDIVHLYFYKNELINEDFFGTERD